MHTSITAVVTLITSVLLACVHASPARRQTPATCETYYTGFLVSRPTSDLVTGTTTNVGIVNNVKHSGINGKQASILVTRDDNGAPLQQQAWEFARCRDLDGYQTPPGYPTTPYDTTERYFGILRPVHATQHCLALESTNTNPQGARNSVVDSYCTQVPRTYRTWMFAESQFGPSDYGQPVYYASQNTSVIISNTTHAELQFFSNTANVNGTKQQLLLAPLQQNLGSP